MNTALVVFIIGVAGTVLWVLLIAREPDRRVRIAATVGGVTGIVFGFLIALAAGTGALAAVATGLIGGAVLALALIVQWRLFRALFARVGGKL